MASSGRRFPSVSAAYADWIASAGGDDLSLGFNAAAGAAAAAGFWGPTAARQSALNYGIAPSSSFHHHQHQRAAAAAADGGGEHPGFALLSAGQCAALEDQAKSGSAIQFWQAHSQPTTPPAAAGGAQKKPASAIDYGGGGGGGSSGSAGSTTCSDCGNQAKKDCPHQRCRTCCKSRGFDCTTHVRSTWIPAARRREKQHQPGSNGDLSPPAAPAAAAAKKPRLLSSQTTTPSTSNGTSSSQQDAPFRDSLPRQLRAPAVFRCVRVTSVDDGEAEFAYQAAVCINGHMFKGFLYDQGADEGRAGNDDHAAGGHNAHAAAVRSISDLHLGSANSAVPPDMYNTVSGALILGGLGYGNTMN